MVKYLLALLLNAVILIAILLVVSAHHKIYTNEIKRLDPPKGYENYVFYDWVINNSPITYYVEPKIRDDVETALESWMHKDIRDLRWATTSDPYVNNVRFEYKDCMNNRFGSVTYSPGLGDWQSVGSSDVNRRVNYLKQVKVCIDSDTNFKSTDTYNGRVNTIAHEIGHIYGLTERYFDYKDEDKEGDCNDSEVTIMDGYNCDGIDKPQANDISRVKSLYSDGSLRKFTYVKSRETSATSTVISWEDHAWAEKEHRIKFYIHDEDDGWRMFGMGNVIDGIHAHRNMLDIQPGHKPYVLSLDFDPEKFSWMNPDQKLPNGATYRFCGAPYFLPFDKEASINMLHNCSESIWLVIPDGQLITSSSSARVNDTLNVNLTGMIPNDLNEFTVKLSGPISRSDECAESDEYVKGLSTFAIYGCAPGTGTLTLQTRRYALTIAEVSITVEQPLPNQVLIDGQAPQKGKTFEFPYHSSITVSVKNLTPSTSTSFMLNIPPIFAQSKNDCGSEDRTEYYWNLPLPKENSVTLFGCDSGHGDISLIRHSKDYIPWPSRASVAIVSGAYNLRFEKVSHNSITIAWNTYPDPLIESQIINGDEQKTLKPSVKRYVDKEVDPERDYSYYITTRRSGNLGDYFSKTITVTVPTPPPGYVPPTVPPPPTKPPPPSPEPTQPPPPTHTPTPEPTKPPEPTHTPTPVPEDSPTPTFTPTATDTPTFTPTPTATATATATYTPTITPIPRPSPPTITSFSNSGRVLSIKYSRPHGVKRVKFELYRSTRNDRGYIRIDSKYDSDGSPVLFYSSDGVSYGYYYRVRGQSCDTRGRCGKFSGLSNSRYVAETSRPDTPTPTYTPTYTPTPTATATPTKTPTPYPPTATPVLCPEHRKPWDEGQCENSRPG